MERIFDPSFYWPEGPWHSALWVLGGSLLSARTILIFSICVLASEIDPLSLFDLCCLMSTVCMYMYMVHFATAKKDSFPAHLLFLVNILSNFLNERQKEEESP